MPILGLIVGVIVGVFFLHSFLWGVGLGFAGGLVGWALRSIYLVAIASSIGRKNQK
jgi:hypothetical protein